MLVYPEDTHAINKPSSEADCWVNLALWFSEHLGHSLCGTDNAQAAAAAGAGGDAGAGAK